MRPKIFISYRRDDSEGHTGRLYDRLVQRFGKEQVFIDVHMILPGQDFGQVISQALGDCATLLAVIGARWMASRDAAGRRRLDDPSDYVRQEIETALTRSVTVVPVLVDRAEMPCVDDLPATLRGLAQRQAFQISAKRFHEDVNELIETIEGKPPLPSDRRPSDERFETQHEHASDPRLSQLVELITDKDLVKAIAKISVLSPSSLDEFMNLAFDYIRENYTYYDQFASAFASVGTTVLQHLVSKLSVENWAVRYTAAYALSIVDHPRAREMFVRWFFADFEWEQWEMGFPINIRLADEIVRQANAIENSPYFRQFCFDRIRRYSGPQGVLRVAMTRHGVPW